MSYKPRRKITADNKNEILNDNNTSYSTKYNILHEDAVKEKNRLYYLKNREKIIQAMAVHKKLNRDRWREYDKKAKLNYTLNTK